MGVSRPVWPVSSIVWGSLPPQPAHFKGDCFLKTEQHCCEGGRFITLSHLFLSSLLQPELLLFTAIKKGQLQRTEGEREIIYLAVHWEFMNNLPECTWLRFWHGIGLSTRAPETSNKKVCFCGRGYTAEEKTVSFSVCVCVRLKERPSADSVLALSPDWLTLY